MPRRSLSKARRQALVDELREAELRATPARVAVLDAVRQAKAPLTHAELAHQLADRRWDAATIYRNLMAITEAGLVQRKDLGDRRWRFESVSADAGHTHPHFVCTSCGDVSCLPEIEIKVERSCGLPRSMSAGQLDVQFRGICDSCDHH